ncbi:MAG: glycoside hydrolase family 3 C-terminal domain-containing protein [Paludibacteraceae bacterium]|nr:glycoside hydrolase family 3 C-terminal domain-containing protein [Paludibacteraceae bacterium]
MTRIFKYFSSVLMVGTSFISCSQSDGKSEKDATLIDKEVDALYERMTQEERLAQLQGRHLDLFFKGDTLDTVKCRAELSNGIGHFSQYAVTQRKTPEQLRDMVAQMQAWLMKNTPNGIPALFHEEALTGLASYGATVYPQQVGLACSFNPELAKLKTDYTATGFRKIGGALALSPMVDVVRNPSFNRLEESYGEDGYLSAVMGVAFVRGLQHEGDLRSGVAACSKHFLGYGGGGNAEEKELMEDILMPHETIIRLGGSKVLMTGYHDFQGEKCVANKKLQTDLLRNYLHFEGVTVSDYGSIDQLQGESDVRKAADAINAGNDVDFPDGNCYKYLSEALAQGWVNQETIASAVKRVLRLKWELGLMDKDAKLYETGAIEFDTKQERELAYQLATQSVVLLKNSGVLPLNKPAKIALVGPNANSMWGMLGDYTYHSMRYFWQREIEDALHPRIVTLKEGMSSKLPQGYDFSYSRGCEWTEKVETIIEDGGDARAAYMKSIQDRMIDSGEKADWNEAIRTAAQSDVIVAAMGENVILCGENRDRTSLRLPGRQEEFVQQLIATGKPVVLIVFGGRAQVISSIADKCAAVIQAWYPGEEGGNALADILYGNVSPSGKLSVSYPAEEIHEPICYNYGLSNDKRIAYPFGYGLSYTTFKYSDLNLQASATTNSKVDLSCSITNEGNFDADEIVQLYISPTDSSQQLKPIQLQGFQRVSLKSGETKTVSFTLSSQQFGYYREGHWMVDPGVYEVKVGASSADIRLKGVVELKGEPYKLDLRTYYFEGQDKFLVNSKYVVASPK